MTVSRQESPTGSISHVTRVVPWAAAASLHRVCIVWTRRRGGSTTTLSPSASGVSDPGCTRRNVEPVVHTDSTEAPKWYLARVSASQMASHNRWGVVRM